MKLCVTALLGAALSEARFCVLGKLQRASNMSAVDLVSDSSCFGVIFKRKNYAPFSKLGSSQTVGMQGGALQQQLQRDATAGGLGAWASLRVGGLGASGLFGRRQRAAARRGGSDGLLAEGTESDRKSG